MSTTATNHILIEFFSSSLTIIRVDFLLLLLLKFNPPSKLPKLIFQFILKSLLDEPNPNSPANNESASLYQSNKKEYRKRVREIVEYSWMNLT